MEKTLYNVGDIVVLCKETSHSFMNCKAKIVQSPRKGSITYVVDIYTSQDTFFGYLACENQMRPLHKLEKVL